MKNSFFKLIASATLLVASASTFAIPMNYIQGKLDFSGYAEVTLNAAKDATTAIEFKPDVKTQKATGDYAVISEGTVVNFSDITSFSPLTISGGGTLWSVGDFSFTLDSITKNNIFAGVFTNIEGTGTVSAAGFSDTQGTWTFSGGNANGIEKGEFLFASSVPAPATIALLGLALVGFGAARRKKA